MAQAAGRRSVQGYGGDAAGAEPAFRKIVDLRGATLTGTWNVAVGLCSGSSLTGQSRSLLLGDRTAAPPKGDGFVNIANKLCFWRDTGERVACPAPELECGGR